MTVAPTRSVWIHGSPEDGARRVWEAGRDQFAFPDVTVRIYARTLGGRWIAQNSPFEFKTEVVESTRTWAVRPTVSKP
jgi:hypothetical protein